MKKIFLKQINQLIEFDNSIVNISIENIIIYKNLIYSILDNVILSENDKEFDNKSLITIFDPFGIDLNESKLVKGLYKKIIGLFDDYVLKEVGIIEKSLFEILDYLSIKIDSNIVFDSSIDYTKLLSTVSTKFDEPSKNDYFDYLINFIKAHIDLNNIKFIISFRLLDFITNEEYLKLESFLNASGVVLLNISFNKANDKIDFIVDEDYCII